MWKIQTAQIMEEIYYSLISQRLFFEEQKECYNGTRGTGDQLFMDQYILKESKMTKNVAVAGIIYKNGLC